MAINTEGIHKHQVSNCDLANNRDIKEETTALFYLNTIKLRKVFNTVHHLQTLIEKTIVYNIHFSLIQMQVVSPASSAYFMQ